MKKIVLLFALLIGFLSYSQNLPVKAVTYKGLTTTAASSLDTMDRYPVFYNTTTGTYQKWNGSAYEDWEVNDLSTNVTWANVPDGNITQSSVTQHQSALSITESQISDLTHNDDQTAIEVPVTDAGALTTQTEVEGYLAENRGLINALDADGDGLATGVEDNSIYSNNIVNTTIDETDLDVSVNVSLDLADSAVQEGADNDFTGANTFDAYSTNSPIFKGGGVGNFASLRFSDANGVDMNGAFGASDTEVSFGDGTYALGIIRSTGDLRYSNFAGGGNLALRVDNDGDFYTEAIPSGGGSDGLGSDGDKGDITVGGSGTTLSIDASSVTSSKIADGTIIESDLNANTPVDEYVLTFESDFNSLEWQPQITDTDDQTASEVPVTDSGANYTATDVEGVLAEIAPQLGGSSGYEILVSTGTVAAVNSALSTAGSVPVRLTVDIPAASEPIVVGTDQTFIFEGQTITPTNSFTGASVVINENNDGTDRNITVIGGYIEGSTATTEIIDAVRFDSVTRGRIEGVIARNLEITASGTATGNFRLIQSDSITIKDVEAHNTWRMGIYITDGVANTIDGGYFTGTHDSGIGVVDSPYLTLRDAVVDDCGTSDASNVTINMVDAVVDNLTSINASGATNGNGITVGHSGYPADSGRITNSTFTGNTKGIYFQGAGTWNVLVSNNILISNTTGLRIASGVSDITFTDNIMANTADYFLDAGLVDISIYGNKRYARTNFDVVVPVAHTTTNLFSDAAIRLSRLEQANNSLVSIAMPTSTTNLYGMSLSTQRLTGGTDYEFQVRAHKGTEAGTTVFSVDDAGAVTGGTYNGQNITTMAATLATAVQGTISGRTGTAIDGAMIQTQAQYDADGAPASDEFVIISDAKPVKVETTATFDLSENKVFNDTADASTITVSGLDAAVELYIYIDRASAPTLSGATWDAIDSTQAFEANVPMMIYGIVHPNKTTINYCYVKL